MRRTLKSTIVLAAAALMVCAGAALAFADEPAKAADENAADNAAVEAVAQDAAVEEAAVAEDDAAAELATDDEFWIGDTSYTDFDTALNNVKNDETIKAYCTSCVGTIAKQVSFKVEVIRPGASTDDVTVDVDPAFKKKAYIESKTVIAFEIYPADQKFMRLAGENRYETMLKIVRQYGNEASAKNRTAVLATGENYPDALAASALAGYDFGSIVLTSSGKLDTEAQQALTLLKPKRIVLVGGENALTPAVETAAGKYANSVVRIAGDDRYQTAEKIYEYYKNLWDTTCIVATGENYADALSVSPIAYKASLPIFLAQEGKLSDSTFQIIKNGGFKKIIIVGGENAVSKETADQLSQIQVGNNSVKVERWYGATRYETSAQIAVKGISDYELSSDYLTVATGENFPDALCGGVLAGRNSSVMALVNIGEKKLDDALKVPKYVLKKYESDDPGFVLGGTVVVSDEMVTELGSYLKAAS